jgi:hypothetical protein
MNAQGNALGVALFAELFRQALAVQSAVIQANAENRELTRIELDALTKRMDDADASLDAEIAKAEAEGR